MAARRRRLSPRPPETAHLSLPAGRTFAVSLTTMAPGGEAVGRHDGKVVFVTRGLPGEEVEARFTLQKRTFSRAEVVAVRQSSPARVDPVCRHFGVCGGCAWQHVAYAEQVRLKTAIVAEQLRRIGGLADPVVHPCLPSPAAYGYRNHARLAVDPAGRIGYREDRSHAVVPVTECPILEPALAAKLQALARAGGAPGADEVDLAVWDAELEAAGIRYRISPGAFFQANTAVTELLVAQVLHVLDLHGRERVLDLFCGVGLFAAPISRCAQYVVGVEVNAAAAADAQFNLAAVGGRGAVLAEDVNAALAAPEIAGAQWDAVVLDPPRTGVNPAALARVADLDAARLVYVSCDPATLARDVRFLRERGYALRCAQPLDMFPQTPHVEVVAELVREQ